MIKKMFRHMIDQVDERPDTTWCDAISILVITACMYFSLDNFSLQK